MHFHKDKPAAYSVHSLYRPPPLKPRNPPRAHISIPLGTQNRQPFNERNAQLPPMHSNRYSNQNPFSDGKENTQTPESSAAPPSANHKAMFLSSGSISLDTLRSLCNNQEDESAEILERKFNELSRPPSLKRQTLDIDNLITVCSRKLQVDPYHKKALFIRASSLIKKELYNDAINDCNMLMQIDPSNAGAYYLRGCANEKLGKVDGSIEDFTTVLQIDPNHINAAYARGACQNKRVRPSNNRVTLRRQLKIIRWLWKKTVARDYLITCLQHSHSRQTQEDTVTLPSLVEGLQQRLVLVSDQRSNHIPASSNSSLVNLIPPTPDSRGSSRAPRNNPLQGTIMSNSTIGTDKLLSPSHENLAMMVGSLGDSVQFERRNTRNRGSSLRDRRSSYEGRTTFGVTGGNQILQTPAPAASLQASLLPTPSTNLLKTTSSQIVIQESQGSVVDPKEQKQKAEHFHSLGYAARKRGEFHKAIECYTRALEIYPTHFKALFNRGFAFDKVGKFDQAIADYSGAIKIDNNNAFAYYNKGISLDRKGAFDEAILNFSHAIRLEPNKADFYHNRGFAYRKKKEMEKAVKDYTTALKIDPQHFKAFYNRAFCWDKLNKLEEAQEDYTKAVALQPKNVTALHHLATVQEKIGGDRLPLALKNFEKSLQIDQKYALSYNGRGLVLDRFQKHQEALKDFTRAIQIEEKNAVFWHNRGCCYRNMGILENALSDLNRAIALDPRNPIIYSNRGLVLRKLGRYKEAIEDYSNELEIGPVSVIKSYNNRAYAYAKLNMYREAIKDYSKVLTYEQRNVHALHNRGISFERMGQFYDAIADFTRVIQVDPTNANAYFNRGSCFDSQGEVQKAISDYSMALELDMKSGGGTTNQQDQSVPSLLTKQNHSQERSQI